MIGIASSANVFAGNENDRSQVQQFITMLTHAAMTAHCSVVLISHPSLTGLQSDGTYDRINGVVQQRPRADVSEGSQGDQEHRSSACQRSEDH